MTIYFSKNTNGFYDSEINTVIPEDAVEVSTSDYQQLLVAQQNGQVIQANDQGYPVAVNQQGATPEQVQAANKSQASNLLYKTDWTTIPDVANSSLSNPYLSNVAEFVAYRNQVRGIAVNPPTTPATFPVKPEAKWTTV
jgi:hypothetical protein